MTYYILDEELEMIKYFISFNTETCGILLPKSEEECKRDSDCMLYVLLDNVSLYREDQRNSCQLQDRSGITALSNFDWHTHTYEGKGYPSAEDIFKAVKSNKYYVLFTTWGAWSMFSENPITSRSFFENYEKNKKDFVKYVGKRYNDVLYRKSESGRFEVTSELQVSVIQQYILELTEFINSKYRTRTNIKFEPWYLISKNQYFVLN